MDAYYAGFVRRRDTELSHSNSVPSFSSSLLDSVYRSIEGRKEELGVDCRDTMRKKQGNNSNGGGRGSVSKGRNAGGEDGEGFGRIERWTGEERAVARRNSAVEVDRKLSRMWNSSSSGSSDSSSGVFSSSELEPVSGVPAGPSCYGLNRGRPKPVRTGSEHPGKGKTTTKKSRARKISGDLKKVKQPISPGGRLASFLNSLFTARKAKLSSAAGSEEDRRAKSLNASACSSASSYSRSCLSKSNTASTAGATVAPSPAVKRSVRFYPVSVIVDEDNRPCGHKNLDVPVKTEKNRRAEAAAARDLLRTYQKKVEKEFGLTRNNNVIKNLKVYEEDEDDDADSYASSDLFELENLSAVGMQRYGEELPVYETTNLGTNRAIASGLIL
ncbi:unnamed protein product [Cuscuta campestris]|uniref:Protein BIG GRAIN 1-like B n=1 Tax=Cuscuta campestris TaxID=132261 RepID=A0A484KL62_9ASTE|nr:unnamed protein product [Cuscuta campestris]